MSQGAAIRAIAQDLWERSEGAHSAQQKISRFFFWKLTVWEFIVIIIIIELGGHIVSEDVWTKAGLLEAGGAMSRCRNDLVASVF